jgi:hypothetical protein
MKQKSFKKSIPFSIKCYTGTHGGTDGKINGWSEKVGRQCSECPTFDHNKNQ